MHISDGVLSGSVCVASAVVAVVITGIALRKTSSADIPRVAVMTAAFFVASLIHVKLGPTSSHLVLNGLLGAVLGLAAFPSSVAALLFQAILFQHGGLSTLGVNALVMGVPALCAAILFRFKNNGGKKITALRAFLAGFCGVMLSAIGVALFLITAGSEFISSAKLVLYVNIPVALIEGLATMLIVNFLMKVKPDMLGLRRQH